MEINSISQSKKYFRVICLNMVGTVLSVGRIFSKNELSGSQNRHYTDWNRGRGKHTDGTKNGIKWFKVTLHM
jgi:hypothetical protein